MGEPGAAQAQVATAGEPVVSEQALGPLRRIWRSQDSTALTLLDPALAHRTGASVFLHRHAAARRRILDEDVTTMARAWIHASLSERAWVADHLAWPTRLVVRETDGRGCGVLVPPAPRPFAEHPADGDGQGPLGPGGREIRTLLEDFARLRSKDTPITPDDLLARLGLCRQVAGILAYVHRCGLHTINQDLTGLRYSAQAQPKVFWADADQAFSTRRDTPTIPPLPGWATPEAKPGANPGEPPAVGPEVDCQLLARFVLECLSEHAEPGRAAGVEDVGSALDDEGRRLLNAGLSPDAARRPDAQRWYTYLKQRMVAVQRPPEVLALLATPPVVPAGGQVTVCWETRHATQLHVLLPDGTEVAVPRDDLPQGSVALPLTRSGPVRVAVTNHYGTCERSAGIVTAVPLPSLAIPITQLAPAPELVLSARPRWRTLRPVTDPPLALQWLTDDALGLVSDLTAVMGLPGLNVMSPTQTPHPPPAGSRRVDVRRLATFPRSAAAWFAALPVTRTVRRPGKNRPGKKVRPRCD